jgi:hypothetical protein
MTNAYAQVASTYSIIPFVHFSVVLGKLGICWTIVRTIWFGHAPFLEFRLQIGDFRFQYAREFGLFFMGTLVSRSVYIWAQFVYSPCLAPSSIEERVLAPPCQNLPHSAMPEKHPLELASRGQIEQTGEARPQQSRDCSLRPQHFDSGNEM